jgi:branched-chain amino acid aminotransferase
MQDRFKHIDFRPAAKALSAEERAERMQNLGFGRYFTEHMVVLSYREGEGWPRDEMS